MEERRIFTNHYTNRYALQHEKCIEALSSAFNQSGGQLTPTFIEEITRLKGIIEVSLTENDPINRSFPRTPTEGPEFNEVVEFVGQRNVFWSQDPKEIYDFSLRHLSR